MLEDLHMEDFDFLGDDSEDLLDSKSSTDKDTPQDDEFYKYSGKDPKEIYDQIKELSIEELSQKLDVESILRYNHDIRRQNEFQKEYGLEESDALEYESKLKDSFRDYLLLRSITGKQKGLFYHNIIPNERISESGKHIEVYDDRKIKDKLDKQKSTVIVHKTNSDDVDLIEVLCACGKRTYIKLDYDAVDSAVIYSEGEYYPTFDEEITTYEEKKDDGFIDLNQAASESSDEVISNFDFGDSISLETEDYNFDDFSKS